MSKIKYWPVLILITLFIAGCNRPSRATCTYPDYENFDIVLDDPANGSVVSSSSPTLDWHHSESCRPEYFRVIVQMKEKNGVWSYLVDGGSTSYRLRSIADGGEYYWTVNAHQGSIGYDGKSSPEWMFYTGDPCGDSSLLAPVTVGRFSSRNRYGTWISPHDAYRFEWYYPGDCLPEGYYYEFAEDWSFTSILASGETTRNRQYVELELPDCTSGYWRVAAGDRSSHGSFSDKRRFFWATDDSCWMIHVPSIDMTRIHGRVFQDYCPQTTFMGFGGPYPEGCISTEEIGIHADGLERSWEEGIENAQVDLRPGSCPDPTEMSIEMFPSADSPVRQTTVTDDFGVFEFVVQSPGTYCLSITKDQTEASVDLWGGLWTEPLTEATTAYKEINIPAGTLKLFENIGWDEYNYLTMHMEVLTHCRSGDSKSYHPMAFIENQRVPLLARNPDASWLQTRINGIECYFAYIPEDIGESDHEQPTEEEIMDLPVFKALPLPTPTTKPSKPGDATKDCSDYTGKSSCEAAGCTWTPNDTCIK